MATIPEEAEMSEHARGLLRMTRDTEFLQSFLRVDLGQDSDNDDVKVKHVKKKVSVDEPLPPRPDAPRDGDTTPRAPSKTTFSQLTKLLKNPKKKRGKGRQQEEFYTDRDRAATVNMGSRDIKRDIKEKRRLDRSKALQIPDEADPNTLLALGNHEMRAGNVNIAINFVHKALELSPGDKTALVARSKCYLLLGEPQRALADAESALQHDKTFIRAIYQKAECLYSLGDFEHSLMYFHRGHHARPELEGFRLGVQKAQEAIENTIGGKSATTSRVTSRSVSKAGSDSSRLRNSVKPRRAPHLLGELNVDKNYLEQLLQNPDIKCAHHETANHITSYAEEGVAYLNTRQEFWRQRRTKQ